MKRVLLYTILPAMLAAIIGFYMGQSYIRHLSEGTGPHGQSWRVVE